MTHPLIVVEDIAYKPTKAHPSDAGYDVKACISSACTKEDALAAINYAWSIDNAHGQKIIIEGRARSIGEYLAPEMVNKLGLILYPQTRKLVSCGFKIKTPVCMLLVPRSGLACKYGLTLSNSPGVVDPDYRGEVRISLYNTGPWPIFIQDKERVGQALFVPVLDFGDLTVVSTLDDTERGSGGFGSSGVTQLSSSELG